MEVLNMQGENRTDTTRGPAPEQAESGARSPRLPAIQVRGPADTGSDNPAPPPQPSAVEFPQLVERNHDRKRVIPRLRNRRYYSEGSGDEEKSVDFNPDPVPFQGQVFNWPFSTILTRRGGRFGSPLYKVQVVGVSLPDMPLRKDARSSSNKTSLWDRPSAKVKRLPTSRRQGETDVTSSHRLNSVVSQSDQTGAHRLNSFVSQSDQYPSTMYPSTSMMSQMWDDTWSSIPDSDSDVFALSQRDRLIAELEYLDKMRGLKRKGELLPHREPQNLAMGGTKVVMFERFDIMAEIGRLKKVVLPTRARDLYVGRGFKLPESHALNRVKFQYPSNSRNLEVELAKKAKPNWEQKPASMSREHPKAEDSKPQHTTNSASMGHTTQPQENPGEPPLPTDLPEPAPTQPPPSAGTVPNTPGTPSKAGNLLNVGQISDLVNADQLETLRSEFQTLDKGPNGEINFEQVKSKLPPNLGDEELRFAKEVYELASTSEFGEAQFFSLSCMCQRIASLEGPAEDAFQRLDFSTLASAIAKYVDLFQSVDRQDSGQISAEALQEILSTTLNEDPQKNQQVFQAITSVMQKGDQNTDIVAKFDFLACIPYFISLESG